MRAQPDAIADCCPDAVADCWAYAIAHTEPNTGAYARPHAGPDPWPHTEVRLCHDCWLLSFESCASSMAQDVGGDGTRMLRDFVDGC